MGNSDINQNKKSHRYKILPPISPGLHSCQSLSFNPGGQISLENRMQDWKRSAGLRDKRSVVVDNSIKSRPVSTQRGTPTGWLNAIPDQEHQVTVFQGQVSFQPPDNYVNPKRGLSGSRPQRNPSVSRVGSQSSRRSDISRVNQDVPVTPSSRPPSLRLSAKFSKGLLVNNGSHVLNNNRWNNSDQSMRFQLQLSKRSTCRTIKKSSETLSHRMDPLYCLFGSKLPLVDRFRADSDKTERKHNRDSKTENDTLKPVKPRRDVNDVPLDKWSAETSSENGFDSCVAATEFNNTCNTEEFGNVASATESCEADPEAEVTNVCSATACSEMSPEAESTDIYQPAGFNDLNPEIEYGEMGYSHVNQALEDGETEGCEVNQETESDEDRFSEAKQETESDEDRFSEAKQETESGEVSFSEVNQETDSDEVRFSEVKQETDSDEVRFSEVKQETESDEVSFSEVNQETESGEVRFSEVNQETESGEKQFGEINPTDK